MAKQKVHSLTGRITPELMHAAFKAVKRNRGAAGIDKVSVKMFEANLEDNLQALRKDLKKGPFEPKPLRRVFIPKNETEFRPLGIPSVRDRVAQEVVRRLLAPIFEPLFHSSSFAYCPLPASLLCRLSQGFASLNPGYFPPALRAWHSVFERPDEVLQQPRRLAPTISLFSEQLRLLSECMGFFCICCRPCSGAI
jgi:hypothetical protein